MGIPMFPKRGFSRNKEFFAGVCEIERGQCPISREKGPRNRAHNFERPEEKSYLEKPPTP